MKNTYIILLIFYSLMPKSIYDQYSTDSTILYIYDVNTKVINKCKENHFILADLTIGKSV